MGAPAISLMGAPAISLMGAPAMFFSPLLVSAPIPCAVAAISDQRAGAPSVVQALNRLEGWSWGLVTTPAAG
jgi:hypothetical protein